MICCTSTPSQCSSRCYGLGRWRISEYEELDESANEQDDRELAKEESLCEGQPATVLAHVYIREYAALRGLLGCKLLWLNYANVSCQTATSSGIDAYAELRSYRRTAVTGIFEPPSLEIDVTIMTDVRPLSNFSYAGFYTTVNTERMLITDSVDLQEVFVKLFSNHRARGDWCRVPAS